MPGATSSEQLRLLPREVSTTAYGDHDDRNEYYRVMAEQLRTVVLIEPIRLFCNR
jgi:hypothetical protein